VKSACVGDLSITHSQYLIPIAISLQQWLQERASMLRYTYSACLVMHYLVQVSNAKI
jgi:hypothetical protein